MEIIENNTVHWTPFKYSHEEFDGENFHVYFAYNIEYTVTGANSINATVTAGVPPISVTAEHLTHSEMTAQGNIYAIHVVLAPYYYQAGSSCNRTIRVTGGWGTEELPIDIPITTQVIQVGCEGEPASALFYVHEDEPIIDSRVPYQLSGGAELTIRNSKWYVKLTSITMRIKLELNGPMRIGQEIEIHTQQKYKPAITGVETRSTHNGMVLDGGEKGDYIYKYTIVGDAQDSKEGLEGKSTLYVWQSGSATHIRSIDIH